MPERIILLVFNSNIVVVKFEHFDETDDVIKYFDGCFTKLS